MGILDLLKERKETQMKRWLMLIFLSAFLGIYTAEMIVYLPDWWREFVGLLMWLCKAI